MKMRIIGLIFAAVLVVSAVSAYHCCGSYIERGERMQRDDATSPFPSYNYPNMSHAGANPANDYYPDDFSKGYTKGYMNRTEQIMSPL